MKIFSLTVLAALLTMIGCKSRSFYNSKTLESQSKSTRIVVVGDIQMRGKLLRNSEPFTLAEWKADTLQTTEIDELDAKSVFAKEKPDVILQTGDFAEWGNSLSLKYELESQPGSQQVVPAAYDEYADTLTYFPKNVPLFPAVGNHDAMLNISVLAKMDQSGKIRLTGFEVDPKKFKSSSENHASFSSYFSALKDAVFHQTTDEKSGQQTKSGSYFIELESFCLVSFQGHSLIHAIGDGLSLTNKTLLAWIETSLQSCSKSKPVIVENHFPIFSAQPVEKPVDLPEDSLRELVAILKRNNVSLFLSAHEHVYLRYKPEGFATHGYSGWEPGHTVYMAISNFGLPSEFMTKAKQEARGLFKSGTVKLKPRLKFDKEFDLSSAFVDQGVVFYDEPHYAVIDVTEGILKVAVHGFATKSKTWSVIDTYQIGRSDDGTWRLLPSL